MATNKAVPRAEAVIDLGAIRDNVAALRERAGRAELMAVVKAEGYGHGLLASARAARAGGASWLGVAVIEEALALRRAGDTGPILCWLAAPGEELVEAVAAGIDLSASAPWMLDDLSRASTNAGRPARVHLKVDTGLTRAGAGTDSWTELFAKAARSDLDIVALWSHLACADEPKHPANADQLEAFQAAIQIARQHGIDPPLRHLANSGGLLGLPETHFDLVRPGIATYGLSPFGRAPSPVELGLRPAMTLRGRLALVKQVGAGAGVSYGHTHVTESPTRVGLLPIGYGDGLPWHASGAGPVWVNGARRTIVGRMCMDQCVIDLGRDAEAGPGDEVVAFGPGDRGEPTVDDWADVAGTLNYEIVTRIGARVRRTYLGEVN